MLSARFILECGDNGAGTGVDEMGFIVGTGAFRRRKKRYKFIGTNKRQPKKLK